MKKHDAIGYTRLSIEDQSKYSLPAQSRAIEDYCERYDLNLLQIFTDNGNSSYTFDRPDWKALELFIKKNKQVPYLIISEYDRFSRNVAEALQKMAELNKKYNIKILTTSDTPDTDFTDPSNYMMRTFKLMMAESELMSIRKRIKLGMLQAAKSGYWVTAAPYGYVNSRMDGDKPTLAIDPDKAAIVKKIFSLTAKGTAPQEIRRQLPDFKMKGNSAIRRMLTNQVYIGMVRVPKYKDVEEYYIRGKHPAIIDAQLYAKVQGQGTTNKTQAKEEVPLRGVLKCWCGKNVTAGNSRSHTGKYHWYYLCSAHKGNFRAELLHKKFNELLSNISLSSTDVEYLRERVAYKIGAMMQSRGEDLDKLKKEITAIKSKISATEEKYLSNPEINPDVFKKVITEFRQTEKDLKKRYALLTATSNDYMAQLEFMLPKLMNLSAAYDAMSLEKKQRFIKVIFGENLNWSQNSYRTPFVNPIFSYNELTLKEKGLLIIEKPVRKIGENSTSTPSGSIIEPLAELFYVLKTA